jgi:PST family polysaccharide transporter
MLSLTLVLSGMSAQHLAQLRRGHRFGVVAANDLASLGLGLLAAYWLAKRGAGYWALVAQQLVQCAATALGAWTSCRWRPALPKRTPGVGPIVRYGLHLTAFNVMNYFARNADNCLIGRYCGSIALGLYTRAYQLFQAPLSQVTWPLSNVALATLSRLTDDPETYRRSYLGAVEKIAIVTVPIVSVLLVCADWVVAIALGPRWHSVAGIFRILALAGLVQPMTSTLGWLFMSQGRTRDMAQCGAITAALAVASFVVGLPWGVRGVATSYVFVDLLLRTPITFALVGRSGPVSGADLWRLVGPFAAIGATIVGLLFVLRGYTAWSNPWAGIAASAALATVVAAAALSSYKRGRLAALDLLKLIRGMVSLLVGPGPLGPTN